MRTALEYARTFGIPVADHCEEPTLAANGAMHEGLVSARLGLKGIPAEAEEIMAIRDILLARLTGGHIHLCHMSTRGSVELIRWGKEPGGTLKGGAVADVTVFDPGAAWTVDPARFRSKGRNTPYAGQTLRGQVELTLVRGRVIHRRGQ